MTVETPAHRQRCDLIDACHPINAAMAGFAADALVHVNGVVEEHEVRQVRDTLPGDRPAITAALPDELENRAVIPDLTVAVQAQLGGRYPRMRRVLRVTVAIQAIDA